MEGKIVAPGYVLGRTSELCAGEGTYEWQGVVYASLNGLVSIVKSEDKNTVTVTPAQNITRVPAVGDFVLCVVTQITVRQAMVNIVSIEGYAGVLENVPGVVRLRDIRGYNIDKIEVYKSMRPGDVVRATVLSLGDARSYYLSTIKVDCGVVHAIGKGGVAMEVIDQENMICPVTKFQEPRKVAKVGQMKVKREENMTDGSD